MAVRKTPFNPAFDPFGRLKHQKQTPVTRRCEHPGCQQAGEYRAPRDRTLRDYMWLCLDHVREHNQKWNFCDGMSQNEVEDEIRRDTCWQRPTWKLGSLGVQGPRGRHWSDYARDDFGIFSEDVKAAEAARRARAREQTRRRTAQAMTAEAKAVGVLEIDVPFTREELRGRYLSLAKKYHPDLNPGDPLAEDRLKEINDAYKTLLKCLNESNK